MKVMNNVRSNSVEEVGGTGACLIACGIFCYGTAGAGTVVASAAYLL